jgi:hypothetical protein
VFTEPLLRNGLHNPFVPSLHCADDIESTASSIVTLLPGNAIIKSVTLLFSLRFFKSR